MNMRHIIPLLAALFFLLLTPTVSATHLVGGNLTWEYLGDTDNDGDINYRIVFKNYQDCNSQFWGGAFPESSLGIGIYEGVQNPSASLLTLTDSLTVFLIDSTSITPDFPPGCPPVGVNPCFYEMTYEGFIDLPVTFSGYHMYYDRCCRNAGTVNLQNPDDQGLAFYAWMGPTLLQNSSPVFTNPPAPYLCVGDTTSILNTAFDSEGDLLIFSFAEPYRGNTGNGVAGNPPPDLGVQNPIPWPINTVDWNAAGFDENNLFGPTGYQYINAFTGYSEYMSTVSGP